MQTGGSKLCWFCLSLCFVLKRIVFSVFMFVKVLWVLELAVFCGIPEVKFVLISIVKFLVIKVTCEG